MVDHMTASATGTNSTPVGRSPATTILAVVFHLGMLAVVFSCVFTVQPPTYGRVYFGLTAALGVAVVLVMCIRKSGFAASPSGRAATALMAGICYSKAYDPQLTALFPSWGENLPMFVTDIAPGLATIGLLLAIISAALYLIISPDRRPVRIPFGWATAAAGLLVAVLGVLMYILLAPIYELQGGMYTTLLLSRVLEYTLLLLVVQVMAGARGVGALTTWYLALALVAAAIRNSLAGPI